MFKELDFVNPESVASLKSFSFSYLLLDGYEEGERYESKEYGGVKTVTQHFQGKHSNEYLVADYRNGVLNGTATLYNRQAVSLKWKHVDGVRRGRFVEYEHGMVKRSGDWIYIVNPYGYIPFIENTKHGKELALYDQTTGNAIYRGDYLADLVTRNGYGIEYDQETGRPLSCGLFENDVLTMILKDFHENGVMYEYSDRKLVYIGAYIYDKNLGQFLRHGEGRVIDPKSGIATWFGEWINNNVGEGQDLTPDGWYQQEDEPDYVTRGKLSESTSFTIRNSTPFNRVPKNVSELIYDRSFTAPLRQKKIHFTQYPTLESLCISSMCFTDAIALEIVNLRFLQHIVLGNDSGTGAFQSTPIITISNLPHLVTIEFGMNAMQHFHKLEMKNLPCLEEMIIGESALSGDQANVMKSRRRKVAFMNDIEWENLPNLCRMSVAANACQYVGNVVTISGDEMINSDK